VNREIEKKKKLAEQNFARGGPAKTPTKMEKWKL
jgi:hypothetical protein